MVRKHVSTYVLFHISSLFFFKIYFQRYFRHDYCQAPNIFNAKIFQISHLLTNLYTLSKCISNAYNIIPNTPKSEASFKWKIYLILNNETYHRLPNLPSIHSYHFLFLLFMEKNVTKINVLLFVQNAFLKLFLKYATKITKKGFLMHIMTSTCHFNYLVQCDGVSVQKVFADSMFRLCTCLY